MILLTKLTKEPFYLNPHFIERVEETPNTVITLISEKKIVVLERAEDISNRMIAYYRKVYTPLFDVLSETQQLEQQDENEQQDQS